MRALPLVPPRARFVSGADFRGLGPAVFFFHDVMVLLLYAWRRNLPYPTWLLVGPGRRGAPLRVGQPHTNDEINYQFINSVPIVEREGPAMMKTLTHFGRCHSASEHANIASPTSIHKNGLRGTHALDFLGWI